MISLPRIEYLALIVAQALRTEASTPFFTLAQASRIWGVSDMTVYKWAKEGKIDAPVPKGKTHPKVSISEVMRLLWERGGKLL